MHGLLVRMSEKLRLQIAQKGLKDGRLGKRRRWHEFRMGSNMLGWDFQKLVSFYFGVLIQRSTHECRCAQRAPHMV